MMKDMPFTSAVLQETYRFRTPTPASLMHQTVKDAELEGYFIPKGTRVSLRLFFCDKNTLAATPSINSAEIFCKTVDSCMFCFAQ